MAPAVYYWLGSGIRAEVRKSTIFAKSICGIGVKVRGDGAWGREASTAHFFRFAQQGSMFDAQAGIDVCKQLREVGSWSACENATKTQVGKPPTAMSEHLIIRAEDNLRKHFRVVLLNWQSPSTRRSDTE
jgi:hypothetical protein